MKGGTPKAKRKLSDPRVDPNASEKPLFSIDATNADKYKDKLSAGQIELLKSRKGYRLDVYPTHRSNDVFEEAAPHSRGSPYDYFEPVQQAQRDQLTGHEYLRRLGGDGMQTPV